MEEIFAERMRYLLSEIAEEGEHPSSVSELIKKVEVTLDKFQSNLGNDKIINFDDKSAVSLWVEQLEIATYTMEDALGLWIANSVVLDARWDKIKSDGMLALFAQCCVPVFRWSYAKLDSWNGLTLFVSDMDCLVESMLLKGMKLVGDKSKRLPDEDDHDQGGIMVVREDDKTRLLEHLLCSENGKVEVISIVGFGGSGKTTLARSLYNHASVGQHFPVRVWVRVSDNISDESKMARKLLDSLKVPYAKDSGLEPLMKLLEESFSGKVVLAVFDDVRAEEGGSRLLEPLKKLFGDTEIGSRILVTTRNERADGDSGIVHTLAPLSIKDCWLILKSTVADAESVYRNAKELLKRCEGSPLVAKMIGMKLHSIDAADAAAAASEEVFTEEVCMVRFRQFYHTYENLPSHMKACLLYCAIFPRGAFMDADKLIRLWSSQGYLGYPCGNGNARFEAYRNVREKGTQCLIRLRCDSFLQEYASHSIHQPYPLRYQMPDEARAFVTYMARLHGDRKGRSFFGSPDVAVNAGLFEELKRVTALVLSSCELDQLPEEVRLLTRLQYLDLSDNPLKRLPPAICDLYHLEFLDLHFCYLLSCLPGNIKKLKQMRCLRMNHTTEELHDLPLGFEKLTLMLSLDVYRVGGKYKDNLEKLKGLKHLQDICISVHGEVLFPDAELEHALSLANLELSFVGEGRKQEMASSIEGLIPPPSLKMLKFEHYPLVELPKWILGKSVIDKLTRLSLRSAPNITSLPALWKLSCLEFLWLYDIPKLKHLGCDFFGLTSTPQQPDSPEGSEYDDCFEEINDHIEANLEITEIEEEEEKEEEATFRSLKTLRIEYLQNWETWEDANEANEFNIKVMPCLKELVIDHCPKLEGKPLRILKDTPWFELSYQNKKEAREKNMKQNSPPDNKNKGAYMKLKKFMHDAYMTKAPAQPLKVSIPEGVLGKTGVTLYLPLDSLHEWFRKDRSIFAEQMCVWSKLVYELMTTSDKERVQMASSDLITTVGRQEDSGMRAEDLIDFMLENEAKLYLIPFLISGHWELLAIVPETEVIYWFDSLQGDISLELTEFLNMVERKYVTRNSTLVLDSWKIVEIKHKRQVGNWESGYYVMIWMHKIALEIQGLSLESHFPTDKSSYDPNKLREVDWKWCEQVMPKFLA